MMFGVSLGWVGPMSSPLQCCIYESYLLLLFVSPCYLYVIIYIYI